MNYNEQFINLLKDPLIRSAIQDKNFRYIYECISGYKGVFTQFCYEVLEVDPLKYMDYIPSNFLDGCETIKEFIIPSRVTSIGYGAFYNCNKLKSVTIGDSVTTIGSSAFEGCSKLTKVVIPDSVTSIGSFVFKDCISLKTLKYNGTKEQWRNMSKGYDWDKWAPVTKVICTDGIIEL